MLQQFVIKVNENIQTSHQNSHGTVYLLPVCCEDPKLVVKAKSLVVQESQLA